MIYIIIALGLLLVGIGFLLTENNARYILSGYNTMNDEERKSVSISAYVLFFRKFHFFLGISLAVLGLGLQKVTPVFSGIFITIYPLLGYVYFIWKSSKLYKYSGKSKNKAAIYILLGILVFVTCGLMYGIQESELVISDEYIEIEGQYGEQIALDQMASASLVNNVPAISYKTNGLGLGTIRKGHFLTQSGEEVKLMINSQQKPILLLVKVDGTKIYYSAESKSNKEIFNEIKIVLPNISTE